jgi:peptidylprolyl isomerase
VPISASLDPITVTGERLAVPKIEFATPFTVDKTLSKVLVEGDGATIDPNGVVVVFYYGVNGRTGERFDDNFTAVEGTEAVPASFSLNAVIPGFRTGLGGQKIGSRVLVAMPGSEAYDSSGGNSNAGIAVGDSLVFVADIVGGSLPGPEGKAVEPPADLPKVSENAGSVEITIPDTAPPTKLVTQTLIEGTGEKVNEGSLLASHYVAYSWKTKAEVMRVYDTTDQGLLGSSLVGLAQGLDGQKVGSRVLLIVPPELGFTEGSNEPPVEKGDTLVFVVDLLFAEQAQ